jgi:3-dehydroquinate dehydratase-2
MAKVLLLNGPNLNLLGTREPEKYGMETLDNVISKARVQCEQKNLQFDHFQSNHEGVMIDRIHQARSDGTSYIVINAGAWTHTSVALVDALSGIDVPFVEVHVGKCLKVIRFASLTVYRTLFS